MRKQLQERGAQGLTAGRGAAGLHLRPMPPLQRASACALMASLAATSLAGNAPAHAPPPGSSSASGARSGLPAAAAWSAPQTGGACSVTARETCQLSGPTVGSLASPPSPVCAAPVLSTCAPANSRSASQVNQGAGDGDNTQQVRHCPDRACMASKIATCR